METMRPDVFLHMTGDFPPSIWEFVRRNPDGYDVYINDKLTIQQQREAYLHALEHINNGDLDGDCSVDDAEWRLI